MEQSTAAHPSTDTTLPEKPAAVQHSMPQHTVSQAAGQQPHFQPYELPKVEPFRPSKPFSVAKVTIASCNVIFAITALGLAVGLICVDWAYDSILGDIIAAAAAGASIVWQLADFITMLARHSIYRPIHPGAHVGVHLLLDVLCILVVGSLCTSLSYSLYDWNVNPDCANDPYGEYYDGESYVWCGTSFASVGQANKYFHMLEALIGFTTCMAVAHFVLFVMACVEADRRRKYGKKTKVVYLVAAPGPVDGRTYYTPLHPGHLAAQNPQPANAPAPPMPVHQAAADPEAYGYYAPAPATSPTTAAPARLE